MGQLREKQAPNVLGMLPMPTGPLQGSSCWEGRLHRPGVRQVALGEALACALQKAELDMGWSPALLSAPCCVPLSDLLLCFLLLALLLPASSPALRSAFCLICSCMNCPFPNLLCATCSSSACQLSHVCCGSATPGLGSAALGWATTVGLSRSPLLVSPSMN